MNILLAASCLAGCSFNQAIHIQVSNPIDLDRNNEFIEVPMQSLQALALKANERFVVLDVENKQVPYQVTHDSLLIFPVSVASKGNAEYTVTKGIPDSIATISCGKYYPERLDDIAWEMIRLLTVLMVRLCKQVEKELSDMTSSQNRYLNQ